jgi:hypothetical protein
MRQTFLYGIISLLMAVGLITAVPAFAQSTPPAPQGSADSGSWQGRGHMGPGPARIPGIFGTVSTISGTTLTVTSKGGPATQSSGGTTYTVNASSATVMKDGATSTVSAIVTGDTVMVQGTVSGTSITATRINDGLPPQAGGMPLGKGSALASLQGNGEPVIGGSVSAISGDTLTVTNKSNVTYSVDATNATVVKGNATSSLASIATGDSVVVQGTVNGTSVTASTIIDQGAQTSSGSGEGNGGPGMMHGFGGVFGVIGGFFQHLFGFF